jgi:integrase
VIFKRDRFWHYCFWRDGIRHQGPTRTTNKKNALRIEEIVKEELNNNIFGIVDLRPNLTFAALLKEFAVRANVRPYHHFHFKNLSRFFSGIPVRRITKALVEQFRRARRIENPNLTDASINRDVSVLNRILNWALDEGLIALNSLAHLRLARERHTKRQVMSVEEEETFRNFAATHVRIITIAALDTGMRRGELLHQRWEDIDFNQRLLWVTKSKTPEGESREIPLTNRLLTLLSALPKESATVFTYKSRPLHSLKTAWASALRRAGMRHIRFHDLRHTFATRLVEAGVIQEIRMALMGHSSGARVHGTYIHVEFPAKREAIQKLEQWTDRQRNSLKENDRANFQTGSNNSVPISDEAKKAE